jgi:hypothetical protein
MQQYIRIYFNVLTTHEIFLLPPLKEKALISFNTDLKKDRL